MITARQGALTLGVTAAVLLATLPLGLALARGRGVGLHRRVSRTQYDSQQLRVGQQIELEHTADPALAVEIAKDHLAEDPQYYSKLCQHVEPREPKCRSLLEVV